MRKPYLSKTIRQGLKEIVVAVEGRPVEKTTKMHEASQWVRRMERWCEWKAQEQKKELNTR